MNVSRLQRSEYIGFISAAVLLLAMFLPWFATSEGSNGRINGAAGSFNAWDTFAVLDFLLAAACSAPFILAWIVTRGHDLSWRPGEVTMIVGMTAFVLILLNGIVLGRPGEPDSEISLKFGYFVAMLGALGLCLSGVLRQASGVRTRRPPGTF